MNEFIDKVLDTLVVYLEKAKVAIEEDEKEATVDELIIRLKKYINND